MKVLVNYNFLIIYFYQGKGILIQRIFNKNIIIKCQSECSVFINSYFVDIDSKIKVGSSIHKILSNVTVKVFDWEIFVIETKKQFNLLDKLFNNLNQQKTLFKCFREIIKNLKKKCIITYL